MLPEIWLYGLQRYCIALIEQKFRIPRIQVIKDEAVVAHCVPLITKEMGYHPLSLPVQEVSKMEAKRCSSSEKIKPA